MHMVTEVVWNMVAAKRSFTIKEKWAAALEASMSSIQAVARKYNIRQTKHSSMKAYSGYSLLRRIKTIVNTCSNSNPCSEMTENSNTIKYVFNVIVLRMLRTVPLLNYLSCVIEFDSQIHHSTSNRRLLLSDITSPLFTGLICK